MKKFSLVVLMVIGLGNITFATTPAVQDTASVAQVKEDWKEVDVKEVPEVVMTAFDAAYQNIGIEKIETGFYNGMEVYKFTIINYERKELTAYFTPQGQELKF